MEKVKLTNDVVFKGTFAKHQYLIKTLVKSLLEIDIKDVEYKNVFDIPKYDDDKPIELDLKFKDDLGHLYDLEMQTYHIDRG